MTEHDEALVERAILTHRPISHDEARACAQRLINSFFHNENGATVRVPADKDNDDDLVLMAYIKQQNDRAERDAAGLREARQDAYEARQRANHAEAERDALKQRNKELVEALTPFAKLADEYNKIQHADKVLEGKHRTKTPADQSTSKPLSNGHRISVSLGECRNAHAALVRVTGET